MTPKEIERQLRMQIESVVFELMSWREGFFSFEERPASDLTNTREARIRVSTESLLMEGARRIDEWSRIADKVPSLGVVPVLAPVREDGQGSQLDLLPPEWEVLSTIDGARDLRAIAATLGRAEFDIARVVYGLVTSPPSTRRGPRSRAAIAIRRSPWLVRRSRRSPRIRRRDCSRHEHSPRSIAATKSSTSCVAPCALIHSRRMCIWSLALPPSTSVTLRRHARAGSTTCDWRRRGRRSDACARRSSHSPN